MSRIGYSFETTITLAGIEIDCEVYFDMPRGRVHCDDVVEELEVTGVSLLERMDRWADGTPMRIYSETNVLPELTKGEIKHLTDLAAEWFYENQPDSVKSSGDAPWYPERKFGDRF